MSGKIIFRATRMPLPTAVPRCSWNRSIAARMSSRLCVGDCTTDAVAANDTTPMRVDFGCSATNARAASCAAAMRLGLTSVARMLPETSIARITVSCCDGSVTMAAGRAIATSISASATRNSERRDVPAEALARAHRILDRGRGSRSAARSSSSAAAGSDRDAAATHRHGHAARKRATASPAASAHALGDSRRAQRARQVLRQPAAGGELAAPLAQVREAQDRVDEIVVASTARARRRRRRETPSAAPPRAPLPPPRSAGGSRGRACRRTAARRSRRPGRRACRDRAAPFPAGRRGAPRRRRGAARGGRAARPSRAR